MVLTAAEADTIINFADISQPLGIRDRAILETFYSTGMRRNELVNLKLNDLDMERGVVMIRQGKGKKDRCIPIGERALAWIDKYLIEARPLLIQEPDNGAVFISNNGSRLTDDALSRLVRWYVDRAQLSKRGSCHMFRHTMATLMLENGADIRFIQQMLGHAELSTTQVYTQVSIRRSTPSLILRGCTDQQKRIKYNHHEHRHRNRSCNRKTACHRAARVAGVD
jgi:integrase/recombinase XerD